MGMAPACIGGVAQAVADAPGAPDFRSQAALSLAFLQQAIDRRGGALYPYHRIVMHRKPGLLRHAYWDWSENLGRWLYGSISARRILGDTVRLEFEESLRREIYKGLGADGLHYYPADRPCERNRSNDVAILWDNRSIFMGLTELWSLTREKALQRQLDQMVESLEAYAIQGPEPGQAYFAVDEIPRGYRPAPAADPVFSLNSGGFILPLLNYHRLSGNERALRLALALANFGVRHHHPERHPSPAGPVLGIWNVHGALFAIAGVAAAVPYMKTKGEHLTWARKLYEFARDHLASSYGWVAELETHSPGIVPAGRKMDTEGCAIVDLAHLGVRLARQGYEDAWNLVERFARNYMEAGQLRDTRSLEGDAPLTRDPCSDNEGMPGRARGAFVGHGAPADFFCPEGRRGAEVQNCCSSHFPFGLHLIWENIVTEQSDGVHVNLAFSRETPSCRVVSERPRRGRVTVTMKKQANLFIRVPDWADKRRVELRVGSRRVDPAWKGDFLYLRGLRAGTVVQAAYPLRHEKVTERFMGYTVQVEWRGDTVVEVSPGGTVLPLFERKRALGLA